MSDCGKGSWHTRGGKTYGKYKGKSSKPFPKPNGPLNNGQFNIENYLEEEKGPYNAWRMYFPDKSFKETFDKHQKVQAFESYIKKNKDIYSFDQIQEHKSFTVDLQLLLKDDFISDWPSFENDLNISPEHTVNCLGLAMHQTIYVELEQNLKQQTDEDVTVDLSKINVRLINHSPIIQLKNLKVNYYGKLASVRGTVIRVSNVKLICESMAFQCGNCERVQILRQPDGVYTLPTKCSTAGCKNHTKFLPMHSSPFSVTNNWQLLKLQESVGSEQCEGGRIPRTVECELTNELVECCTPGDDVTITGIIRVRNQEEHSRQKQASMFLLYIDVVSVVNNKNQTNGSHPSSSLHFNVTDYYAIQKIHAEPNLFKLLVHSLCPAIYGHEVVKAGLLLGLMGGTNQNDNVRSDIHVLVVGDPGLGKSQMLQSCCNAAARGVFVCGNTSTNSGLTLTMTRETGGEYSLEAGALVLADQGCCCIDEFDKMTANHAVLLEAMEQQTISIAKAGVVCTLPARTSILAAANPVGGHYNKAKTVSENLRMSSALLSRFDLAFILLDKPDEHLDSLLSEHVLALHAGLKRKRSGTQSVCSESTMNDPTLSLRERLKLLPGEELDVIPHQLLRKFISYTRKYVHPTLSEEAAEQLKIFYLELRKQYQNENSIPVTTRQLHSLIRLTQARAKLELREKATATDAIDVIEIMKYSLVDTFSDDCGSLDFSRSDTGSGISGKSRIKEFVKILQRKAELDSKNLFTTNDLKEIAQRANINGFYDVLNSLNLHGYLLKKGNNLFQLQTADF